ncbi:MAG: HDIG domain-containing protein [Candidatus Edwardsbacteria bacterium]|nr:HDIG domain-containing protein [Candidatus Edwardsbacteria bacterium]MBU1577438.1 HDIG domain-containing protein [Candidatus Edwardsbacteria bacterium]MBU2463228.1 HDIG domain-containing protein [Candidatus Edwardsbacteria bacterium]MBU2593005.1 HDIG domain-containing protein [Candidatus Edwardsbacteria bacterium]
MKISLKNILSLARNLWPLHPQSRKFQIYWIKRVALAGVLLLIIANLFSPARNDDIKLKIGSASPRDIHAPFDFPLVKDPALLKAQQDSAASQVLAIVYRNPEFDRKLYSDVELFLIKLFNLRQEDEYLANQVKVIQSWKLNLSRSTTDLLLTVPGLYSFQQGLKDIVHSLLEPGVLPLSDSQAKMLGSEVVLRQGQDLKRIPSSQLFTMESLPLMIKVKSQAAFPNSEPMAKALAEVASKLLEPNLAVDTSEVGSARARARESVSKYTGQVAKGEKIVSAYQKVDQPTAQKLNSLQLKLEEITIVTRRSGWNYVLTLLSRLLALGFFLGILTFYLIRFRPEVFRNFHSLLILATIILLSVLSGWLVLSRPDFPPYLLPAALGPILTSLMFDIPLGAVMAVTASLLFGVVTELSLPITVVALASGSVASFLVKGLRSRFQFIITSFFAITLASGLAIAAMEYLKLSTFQQIQHSLLMAPASAFLSIVLTLLLLPVLEAVFNTTTDYSLLEMADPDQPLLKRLSIEATGTFQHSLLVGNLAEVGAKAIGANSLQARIMGYYHDIGKLAKPDYFIENQAGVVNRHDSLAPKMSFLVVAAHVKEGLELAKKHRLPQIIKDAIAQHHGTTLSKYFYHKANLSSEGKLLEGDFRYPGPKPQSKEIGLVMLADVVEASVRSLKDRDPKRVRRMVKATIADKANELELDESNLTLHDLHMAGEAFLPVLLALFHPRIEYPEAKNGGESKNNHPQG